MIVALTDTRICSNSMNEDRKEGKLTAFHHDNHSCVSIIWKFVKQMITSRYWGKESFVLFVVDSLEWIQHFPSPWHEMWLLTSSCLSKRHRHTVISSVCVFTSDRPPDTGYWMTWTKLLPVIDKDTRKRMISVHAVIWLRERIKICPCSAQKSKNRNHAASSL